MFTYVQECRPCHPICTECHGPSSGHCIGCTGYWESTDCVESCPSDNYIDEVARRCYLCDPQCVECNGPSAANCTSCHHMKLYDDLEDRTPDSPVNEQCH